MYIKKYITQYKYSILTGILGLLAVGIVDESYPMLKTSILPQLSKMLLLKCTALFLVIILVLVSYILQLHNERRLKLKLGVFWDNENNTYCPNCKTPISNFDLFTFEKKLTRGFKCIGCNSIIPLIHEGKRISLKKALELISSG